MIHLIGIGFFAALLVALALVLQYTIRDHWRDMVAALAGRPLPSRALSRPATASVPRTRRMRRAPA